MLDIRLEFDDKTIIALAGYDYGKKIFNEQVGEQVDIDQGINLIFPDQIQKLASSFVQGFFSTWVKRDGFQKVLEKVHVQSVHQRIEHFIQKNLIW